MAERKRFGINTEPHVAEIGDDEYLLKPEAYTDELLDAWANLRTLESGPQEGQDPTTAAERMRAANQAVREFLAAMMLDESAERFKTARLPDRVLVELMRWALEVYGLRPTTSSNGSSESSSTTSPGAESTESSPAEELTS